MDVLARDTTVDRYRVEGLLGEGGMARVYRVRHVQLGTVHALKVLTVAAASIRDRLLQEGRVQATLRHPNIVAVTDVIDVAGSPGLVMEFVDGPTLAHLIALRPLAVEQVDALAEGILAGVEAAHAEGLVHRDLKPDNILLQPTRGGLVPKVADFGVVKVLGDAAPSVGRTRTGVAMGTPAYMSPEQIRDTKNVDARSDVFALGVILYEMLAGRRAYPQEDFLRCFNAIVEGFHEPVTAWRPDAPPRMVAAIEGAMRGVAAQRIPDCAELRRIWGEGRAVAPGLATGWEADEIEALRPRVRALEAAPATDRTWAGDEPEPPAAPPAPREPSALDTIEPPPKPEGRGFAIAAGVVGVLAVAAIVAAVQEREPSAPPAAEVAEVVPPPVEPIPTPAVDPAGSLPPTASVTSPASTTPAAPAASPPRALKKDAAAKLPASAPQAAADAPAVAPPESAAPPPAEPAPEPTPEPAPAVVAGPPPGHGRVKLTGDAKSLYLRSSAGNFPAGDIPAGTYTMSAFFEGSEPIDAGTLVVADGQTREVRCVKKLLRCTPK